MPGRTQGGKLFAGLAEHRLLLGQPGVDRSGRRRQRAGLDPAAGCRRIGHGLGGFDMLETIPLGIACRRFAGFILGLLIVAAFGISDITGHGACGFGVLLVALRLGAADLFKHFVTAGLIACLVVAAGAEHHQGHGHL
ncbi:hypothetical protein HED60_10060 [Planctomycetales bacterium ZRK34]|nr:hypothetical protein HED60_10060 [Planctomycetales bacterium ZRK34]